jgi:hypothetical protein
VTESPAKTGKRILLLQEGKGGWGKGDFVHAVL